MSIYMYIYIYIYIYTYVCRYVCMYICMYVCMYVRTYVRTYETYVCMYVTTMALPMPWVIINLFSCVALCYDIFKLECNISTTESFPPMAMPRAMFLSST